MISLLELIVFGYTHRVSSFIGYTYSYRLARNQLALITLLFLLIFKRKNIVDKPIQITNSANPRILAFEVKLLITRATLFCVLQIATKYCFVHNYCKEVLLHCLSKTFPDFTHFKESQVLQNETLVLGANSRFLYPIKYKLEA